MAIGRNGKGQSGKRAKWQKGEMAKGRNVKRAKWPKGEMAKGRNGNVIWAKWERAKWVKGEMGGHHSLDVLRFNTYALPSGRLG
jgi:hypothetical protein